MEREFKSGEQEWVWSRIALLIFAVYAAIGLFLYDDYGCGPDEGMERQTSLVNFKYAIHKLNIPISEHNESWLGYLPELHEYRDRYYGTALHFPLVLIENFFDFSLEPIQFYGMRHFYTFINYFAGVVCFYLLLSERFGSKKYGLAGILMMIIMPRFFGESFYNNKDVIFTAWYSICAYTMDRWFRRKNLVSTALLGFVLAITCNTRFNGIIFIAVFILLFIMEMLSTKRIIFMHVRYALMVLIFFGLFFYIMTPNFWEQPIQTLVETLAFNMRHPNHGSEGNLFKGVLVDAARTLTFIPVWIWLTVPTVYLILSLFGTAGYLIRSVRTMRKKKIEDLYRTDLLMFMTGFAAMLFIIITHVTIYNGWRHCYFVYPCIVYFAVFFIKMAAEYRSRIISGICAVLLGVSFVLNGYWIFKNHPYEYVYFSLPFRGQAGNYSGDYWGISSRALLEYITGTDPERMLLINHAYSQAGSINRGLLPEDERKFIELTYDETDDVDYYIVCRDDRKDTDIGKKDYEKVYSITVDQDEIGAVFKRR